MTLPNGVTRRSLLQGTAAGAAALAAGVVPVTAGAEEAQAVAAQPAINPQDMSYKGCSITDFSKSALFSSWHLGPHEIHNRMVKSAALAMTFMYRNPDEYMGYYERFAKGGVEVVWVEEFFNYWDMTASPMHAELDEIDVKGFVDMMHSYGTKIGMQFGTMVCEIGPMDYSQPFIGNYTTEQVQEWQTHVVELATILKTNGFDAIELNMAANNVGQSFLSRARNNRTDQYDASCMENRTRWGCEVIRQIKEACGKDFVVQCLINAVEINDFDLGNDGDFTRIEETCEMAKYFEAAGADSIHLRIGPTATHITQFAGDLYFCVNGIEGANSHGSIIDFDRHFQGLARGNHSGAGLCIDMAAKVKEAVNIPVGAATYMDPAQAPDYFEAAVAEGKIDFFVMNRPLCVEPDYVNKLREGRLDEIAPCTRCMHCFFDADRDGYTMEHCRVNPTNWRAFHEIMPDGFTPAPAQESKKVMVIGAGPGGMEAARIAAQRGHDVTLYEKSGILGGNLPVAEAIKGPHENLDRLITYMTKGLELAGVNVVTGVEVTDDMIAQEAPDAVIVATGAVDNPMGLEPTAGTQVVDFNGMMGLDCGENVTVLGSGARAVDVALYLKKQGKQVTIVTPNPIADFEKGHSVNVIAFVRNAFTSTGGVIYPNSTEVVVGDGCISFMRNDAGIQMTIACDAVVDMSDQLPNTSITVQGDNVYYVGDCYVPFNISEAISDGNIAARKI